MANMAIEAGAKVGLFPIDELCREFCKATGHPTDLSLAADPGAEYARVMEIEVTGMEPGGCRAAHSIQRQACFTSGQGAHPAGCNRLMHKWAPERYAPGCGSAQGAQGQPGSALHCAAGHACSLESLVLTKGLWAHSWRPAALSVRPPAVQCLAAIPAFWEKANAAFQQQTATSRARMGSLNSEIFLASPAVAAASAIAGPCCLAGHDLRTSR